MRLLVIGASRGLGHCLVEQALAAGHDVTAFARSGFTGGTAAARLYIVRGDVLDALAVRRAVRDSEAVCLTIGARPTCRRVTLFSQGTRVVLQAMQEADVSRLVCVTGIGAGDSRGHGGFLYDTLARPFLLATLYSDKNRQEALVRAAPLAWTVVRPGFLTNGAHTHRYRVLSDLSGVTARPISRADVADYLLDALTSARDVKRTVLVNGASPGDPHRRESRATAP